MYKYVATCGKKKKSAIFVTGKNSSNATETGTYMGTGKLERQECRRKDEIWSLPRQAKRAYNL